MSSDPPTSITAGDIAASDSSVAIGHHITQITLESGQRVERLFMAPAPPPYAIIGRDDLLADLRDRLFAANSVALAAHGQGGVGKTALAIALAWDDAVLEHFSGGVLWAALGPQGHPDTALATLISALLGPEVPLASLDTAARIATIKAALALRSFLIVLDDVWQPDHAYTLRQLASPGCALLLTTRDLDTAATFSSSPISVEELDEQQATLLLSALSPATAPYRAALTNIARAVGGLPLALTLVGGYLSDKVEFQRQAEPTLAAIQQVEIWLGLSDHQRHLSFEQVIALSLDALPDEATRAAFLRLAAFAPKPASFSLDAALAVIKPNQDSEPEPAIIATLIRRNLLERIQGERLTIHPTLARVAEHRCPDLDAAHAAHANFYLELMNADPNDWQTIEAEWEQISHAWAIISATPEAEVLVLPYIGAATDFQRIRGHWHEIIGWLERGVTAARKQDNHEVEANLLNRLGWVHNALGERQQALDYYQQALPIQRQVGDKSGEAATLNNIGMVYHALGDQQQALDYYQQALPIRRLVSDKAGEATTLGNIGAVYSALGDLEPALAYYQQALPIMRQVGDRAGEATTLSNIGLAYKALGDPQQALAHYQQALPILKDTGDITQQAGLLNNIGALYQALGDPQQALTYYQQALPIHRQVGDKSGEGVTANNIGYIYLSAGDLSLARRYLEQALALAEQLQYPALIAAARHGLEAVRRRSESG